MWTNFVTIVKDVFKSKPKPKVPTPSTCLSTSLPAVVVPEVPEVIPEVVPNSILTFAIPKTIVINDSILTAITEVDESITVPLVNHIEGIYQEVIVDDIVRDVPEVLPEVLPEVVPEVVPEVPEVLPEVPDLPEVVVVPEVTSEEEFDGVTALLNEMKDITCSDPYMITDVFIKHSSTAISPKLASTVVQCTANDCSTCPFNNNCILNDTLELPVAPMNI